MKKKQKTKALLALALAVALLLTQFLPVFASEYLPEDDLQHENGYSFLLEETENGPVFTWLVYRGESEEAYVPETLAGIALTPDNFTGTVFYDGWWCASVRVDEDNPYFKTVDGALYTKDGKMLVWYPENSEPGSLIRVPDGVQVLGENCFDGTDCLVVPDSVTEIRQGDAFRWCGSIAASPGTAAGRFASEHGIRFIPMGEGHKHVYFQRTVAWPTCVEGGTAELYCPCGDVRTYSTDPAGHRFDNYVYDESRDAYVFVDACSVCGLSWEEAYGVPLPDGYQPGSWSECGCVCHRINNQLPEEVNGNTVIAVLRDFVYRLKIVIWHLTGTHQYCECGARHW